MHITMIGTGYVGLVTGAGLADLGLSVTCVDKDQEKIQTLQKGSAPFFEPGLDDLVRRNQKSGRLKFTTDIEAAIRGSLVNFIAVGTDAGPDGSPDLSHVWAVADSIADCMDEYKSSGDEEHRSSGNCSQAGTAHSRSPEKAAGF